MASSLVGEKDKGVTGPPCGRLLSMCAFVFLNGSNRSAKSLTLWLLDFSNGHSHISPSFVVESNRFFASDTEPHLCVGRTLF